MITYFTTSITRELKTTPASTEKISSDPSVPAILCMSNLKLYKILLSISKILTHFVRTYPSQTRVDENQEIKY